MKGEGREFEANKTHTIAAYSDSSSPLSACKLLRINEGLLKNTDSGVAAVQVCISSEGSKRSSNNEPRPASTDSCSEHIRKRGAKVYKYAFSHQNVENLPTENPKFSPALAPATEKKGKASQIEVSHRKSDAEPVLEDPALLWPIAMRVPSLLIATLDTAIPVVMKPPDTQLIEQFVLAKALATLVSPATSFALVMLPLIASTEVGESPPPDWAKMRDEPQVPALQEYAYTVAAEFASAVAIDPSSLMATE
jgi:hypothetical protein